MYRFIKEIDDGVSEASFPANQRGSFEQIDDWLETILGTRRRPLTLYIYLVLPLSAPQLLGIRQFGMTHRTEVIRNNRIP